jgi:ATP-binding cassette subfamily G (WHITE) protein 2 (PDR)
MSAAWGAAEEVPHRQAISASNIESSSSSTSEKGNMDEPNPDLQHDREVHDLVQKFTTKSEQLHLGSPFDDAEGTPLDPNCDQFRGKLWARAFYDLRYSSDEAIPRAAGVAFRDLNVWGRGSPTDFQSTVGNNILKLPALFGKGSQKIEILRNLDGLVLPGEQLCVLGPPGYDSVSALTLYQPILTCLRSGCSTLLKTIAGETYGFQVSPESHLNYQGVPAKEMSTNLRGEAIYTAEIDAHFPQLSVGDTLYFAALARAPRDIPGGISRECYAEHLRYVRQPFAPIAFFAHRTIGHHGYVWHQPYCQLEGGKRLCPRCQRRRTQKGDDR